MKVIVERGGVIRAVYSDKLNGIGEMEVSRASNVEFNHKMQEWEARTPDGTLIAHGKDRDEVIKEEIRVIESRL